jgi:hypothetical protein
MQYDCEYEAIPGRRKLEQATITDEVIADDDVDLLVHGIVSRLLGTEFRGF